VFCCLQPADAGGATPLADCRRVLERIPPSVRSEFDDGVMYVRNFGGGLGLGWEEAFGTADPREVERSCAASGTAVEWRPGGRLRTRSVRPAIVRHPVSGEPAWFNHAAFFHASSLPEAVSAAVVTQLAEEDLPANTYHADGRPIDPDSLAAIRVAYAAETVAVPWRHGDVLLVDNVLAAHGREAFEGDRKVLVGMARSTSREQPGVRPSPAPSA
jgi:hypothetical protein